MASKIPALRLGAPVRFKDCWTGRVSSIEIDEEWEALNVSVRYGFPRSRSVRLPLEAATAWDDEFLAFDETTSASAFAREITPIAAPSRPLSAETPISGGGRLAGLLVDRATRRAKEVLLERGGRVFRVPAASVTFEGKVLHAGVQPDALVPYFREEELRRLVRQALAAARGLTPGEIPYITADTTDGGVRLTGNVRTGNSREAARRAVSAALGAAVDVSGLADDIELESAIGLALERAGLTRKAEAFVRCTLGEAIIFGRAPSQAVADEVARTTAHVPGVRSVDNRMTIAPGEAVEPAGAPAALAPR